MVVDLEVSQEVVLGDALRLTLRGLDPAQELTLVAEMTDVLLRDWRVEAHSAADSRGEVRLSEEEVVALLSGAAMAPLPEAWEAPPARDYNHINWSAAVDGQVVARAETRLWLIPPGIEGQRLGGTLVAELFTPPNLELAPGIVTLGGSGGGMQWARRTAALLAREGFAAMAVAYFNQDHLPAALVEIPLEYVYVALDSLKARPEVDSADVSLVGYSKGAELALLLASRRLDVRSVVAFAPGSAVFQGFRAPDYPILSSWSEEGVGLPFVPNAYDDRFFETYDGMYLWYRTLAQTDLLETAAIPVERIRGNILLISGVDDQIWPSTLMAEQIVARLGATEFVPTVRHLAFPEAGHGIAAPPGEPLTSVSMQLGGTAEGNAYARGVAWEAMLSFLRERSGNRLAVPG